MVGRWGGRRKEEEAVRGTGCSWVLRNIKIKTGGINLSFTLSPVEQDIPGSLKTSEDRRGGRGENGKRKGR